jgi:hypothetical protein
MPKFGVGVSALEKRSVLALDGPERDAVAAFDACAGHNPGNMSNGQSGSGLLSDSIANE